MKEIVGLRFFVVGSYHDPGWGTRYADDGANVTHCPHNSLAPAPEDLEGSYTSQSFSPGRGSDNS